MPQAALNLFIVALYCIASTGAGAPVLSYLDPKKSIRGLPALQVSFVLGIGLLGFLWMLLALAGALKSWLIYPILAASCAAGAVCLPSAWRESLNDIAALTTVFWKEAILWQLFGVTVVLFTLALPFELLGASLSGDALSYNWPIATTTAYSGRLHLVPLVVPGMQTLGVIGEMTYAALMILGGKVPAILITGALFIACVGLMVCLGKSLQLGFRGLSILTAMLLTTPVMFDMIENGTTHIFGTTLAVAAAFSLLATANIALAGLLGGLATVALLSNVIGFLPVLCLIVIWQTYRTSSRVDFFRAAAYRLLTLGTWCAIPVILHLVKNWIVVGDALAKSSVSEYAIWGSATVVGPLDLLKLILLYPIVAVFGHFPAQGSDLSYLVLIFLPFGLLLVRSRQFNVANLAVAAALAVAFWTLLFPTVFVPRYVAATYLMVYPLAAYGAELFSQNTDNTVEASLSGLFVLAICSYGVVHGGPTRTPHFPFDLSRYPDSMSVLNGTADVCAKEELTRCPDIQVLNQAAKAGERVLSPLFYVGWIKPELIVCASTFDENNKIFGAKTAESFWKAIRSGGFKFVYLDDIHGPGVYWDPPFFDTPPADISITTVARTEHSKLYRLDYPEVAHCLGS
jgi:hypothetical protein